METHNKNRLNKRNGLIAFAIVMTVAVFFAGFYTNQAIRPPWNYQYENTTNLGIGANKLQIYYYYNGIYQGHHDANITSIGLSWFGNRSAGVGNNNTLTDLHIFLSNSSANCGSTTTHIQWIFNDTAGQGNGLGVKTLTGSNVTWWTTPGKMNYTAKFYPLESVNNVRKVAIAIRSDTVYNNWVAIDVLTPTRNVIASDVLTIVIVKMIDG